MASVRVISGIHKDGTPDSMELGSIRLASLTYSEELIGPGKYSELKMEKSIRMFNYQLSYIKNLLI